jgi:hypothetical protein
VHTLHRLPFSEALSLVVEHATSVSSLIGDVRVITIDGRAGGGKSTLADALSPLLDDAPIVHMDDLYRGWDNALTAQLTATLRDQILNPIGLGKAGGYRAWDWHRGAAGEVRTIPKHPFLILEGVGASQRIVRPFATTMVWIEIPPSRGLERVLQRDSLFATDLEEYRGRMLSWQGEELLHFAAENTFDTAHLRLDGELFV